MAQLVRLSIASLALLLLSPPAATAAPRLRVKVRPRSNKQSSLLRLHRIKRVAGAPRTRMPKLVMEARTRKEMKYLVDPVSKKTAQSIRGKVTVLTKTEPDAVIVFRGQSTLTKTLRAKIRQELSGPKAIAAYEKAAKAEIEEARAHAAKVAKEKYPKLFDQRKAAFNAKMSGPELLALKNQQQLSGKYFVSTTRDLAVACGDFYLAEKMRYVYVLALPKNTGLNLYSLAGIKSEALRVPVSSNQREKEVAIPVDATPYVRAVYDLKTERFVSLSK